MHGVVEIGHRVEIKLLTALQLFSCVLWVQNNMQETFLIDGVYNNKLFYTRHLIKKLFYRLLLPIAVKGGL